MHFLATKMMSHARVFSYNFPKKPLSLMFLLMKAFCHVFLISYRSTLINTVFKQYMTAMNCCAAVDH